MRLARVLAGTFVAFGVGALFGMTLVPVFAPIETFTTTPSVHFSSSAPQIHTRHHEHTPQTAQTQQPWTQSTPPPSAVSRTLQDATPQDATVSASSPPLPATSPSPPSLPPPEAVTPNLSDVSSAPGNRVSSLKAVVNELAAKGGGSGKTVALTFANLGYKEFFDNWVAHVRKLGWTNVLVGAIDSGMEEHCKALGLPFVAMNSTHSLAEALGVQLHQDVAAGALGSSDFRASSHTFHKMGGEKAALVLGLLQEGLHVLLSDSDTAWLRDPWPYLQAYKNVDIMVSSDCPSVYGDRKDYHPRHPRSRCTHFEGSREDIKFNTGVLYFRNSAVTREFVKAWALRLLTSGHLVYDQEAFNQLAETGAKPLKLVEQDDRVFWAWNHKLRLGILPATHFVNGHVYFVQKRPQQLGLHPFVVHPTFQIEGAVGKKNRFREAGLWLTDPDEYYSNPKFLTYSGAVPAEVTAGAAPGIETHLRVTAYHQLALRNAFALAKILGRVVILPRLLCYCDMYWGSPIVPECITWGADLQLPFECPADNVFNLPSWEWARRDWRESSFLDNPKVPDYVRLSRARVLIVPSGITEGCGKGCKLHYTIGDDPPAEPKGQPNPETSSKLSYTPDSMMPLQMPAAVLPRYSNESMVKSALKHFEDVRVLDFQHSTAEAFCGFDNNQDNVAFDKEMDAALNGIWCCSPEGTDPRRNPFAHLKEPDQKPNDGTLRHKKPAHLAMNARNASTPTTPSVHYQHCQYKS